MINISSAMAGEFAFAVAEFTAGIQRLGPSPLRSKVLSPVGKMPIQEDKESAQVTHESSD